MRARPFTLLTLVACTSGKGDSDSGTPAVEFLSPAYNAVIDGNNPVELLVELHLETPATPQLVGFASNLGPLDYVEAGVDQRAALTTTLASGTIEVQAGTVDGDARTFMNSIPVRLDFVAPLVLVEDPANYSVSTATTLTGRVGDDAATADELTLSLILDGLAEAAPIVDELGTFSAPFASAIDVGHHKALLTVADPVGRETNSEIAWVTPGDFVSSPLGSACSTAITYGTSLGDPAAIVTWYDSAGNLLVPGIPGDEAWAGTLPPGDHTLTVTADWGMGMAITQTVTVNVSAGTAWYADNDRDGYGDELTETWACSALPGMVNTVGDCDDTDPNVYPGQNSNPSTWLPDEDGDGFGDASGSGSLRCEPQLGQAPNNLDCDDSTSLISPDGVEVCNGVDEDCDGTADDDAADAGVGYPDVDGDGYGDQDRRTASCSVPAGYLENGDDCDDADPNISPMGLETCDGVDQDCDGDIDEDATDFSTFYADDDGDGWGDEEEAVLVCTPPADHVSLPGDCDDLRADSNPDADEVCGGLDENCDGSVDENTAVDAAAWYGDADDDGYGDYADPTWACEQPEGYVPDNTDCDDTSASVSGGAVEVCNNVDDNCDGVTDENSAIDAPTWFADTDGDTYGDPLSATVSCDAPAGFVADNTDCDDNNAAANPGMSGEYCNGFDDDCDGLTDGSDALDQTWWYDDVDADLFGDVAAPTLACDAPPGTVADDTDCDDTNADTHPDALEYCDGEDDDCDGTTDEDDAVDADAWYLDLDDDGHGLASDSVMSCTPEFRRVRTLDDCDDSDRLAWIGAAEVCDGSDNDCDGSADNTVDTIHGDNDSSAPAPLDAMSDWGTGIEEAGMLGAGDEDWFEFEGVDASAYTPGVGSDDLVITIVPDSTGTFLTAELFDADTGTRYDDSTGSGRRTLRYEGPINSRDPVPLTWHVAVRTSTGACLASYTLELSIGG